MDVTEELLANNRVFAQTFDRSELPAAPVKSVAILACMDGRLDPARALGLQEGDAHVIRNAGGVVTDDAIRSLTISQRLLGTEEIIIIQHTGCGMLNLDEENVKARIEAEVKISLPFALEAFDDLEGSVRRSIARITASPFIPNKSSVRGFVYEVETGRLQEVS